MHHEYVSGIRNRNHNHVSLDESISINILNSDFKITRNQFFSGLLSTIRYGLPVPPYGEMAEKVAVLPIVTPSGEGGI